MQIRARVGASILMACVASTAAGATVAPLSVEQVVAMAVEASPQVRAARARWKAAAHSVKQNYAPADPVVGFASIDSPTNGFSAASEQGFEVSQALQFPGKAILQAGNAQRTAEIAWLSYEAAIRDVRTSAASQCYQLELDQALLKRVMVTIIDLERILGTTDQTRPKPDLEAVATEISEERQNQRRMELSVEDDKIRINALLTRRPEEPIDIDATLVLKPVKERVDDLIERAWQKRQEILEAALHSANAEDALKLARLEYAPDYTVGYTFNHYLLPSDAPADNLTQTHNVWISFNLPLFFWMKQNEDVARAGYDLEAAREDLESLRIDTAARVTILHRHAQFDYQEALTYRDKIVPRSQEAFENSLAAYARHGEDFAELTIVRERLHQARSSYLEAAGRLMEGRTALEQEIGGPLQDGPAR
jgi:outer membrane protein, heavy metal efflux system